MQEYAGIAFIPIIVGIVEILKRLGLKEKYAPLASLACGLILAVIYASEGSLKKGILQGIYFGLSACGLYSGAKNVSEEIRG